MEVNKPEAERCRDMGATALRQGNVSRATKLLQKSLQLYPLPGVEALLQQAQQRETSTSGNNNNNDNNNAAGAANAGGGANTTTTTTSTTAPAPAQRSASMGADGRAYTEEQVKIVQRVLQAKQGGRGAHYRVLNLQSNANEAEIKKAYRKLSLKVHPDKNSAPHADEAFKAVGLAYATLSDPQKRNIYDRYGEEDPDSRGGGGGGGGGPFGGGRRGGGVHMHGQHVDPEDIFNAFFGGAGMPGGGGVHFYSNGFGGPGMHFRPGGPRRAHRGGGPQPAQHHQQQQQQTPGFGALLQILPILLMMLLSFTKFGSDTHNAAASMPGVDRYFSLTPNSPFSNPLATKLSKVKDIPYYVSDRFLRTYYRDRYQLGQVERMVEKAYEQYLFDECSKQTNYKSGLEKQARKEKDPEKQQLQARRAAEFELTRCVELDDLFPDRRSSRNKNQRYRAF